MLPDALLEALHFALKSNGDETGITEERPVAGGCIHHACQIRTQTSSYFLKWNDEAIPGMFSTEARGLECIRQTNTLRVPTVIQASEQQKDSPAFLLMEWIDKGSSRPIDQRKLGEGLAAMHREGKSPQTPASYGLDENNFLGRAVQENGWNTAWTDIFREKRLLPQIDTAIQNGLMPAQRQKRLVILMDRLDDWLAGVERRPCLVHGDLWRGNVMADRMGNPVMLDPAAYYADREVEIAYTQLFHGFDRSFFDAYQAAWPLDKGFSERRDIYNLYHLINHLNHFGEPYGTQVDAILQHYIGHIP